MHRAHIFALLALATRTLPQPPPAFSDLLPTPLEGHEAPGARRAVHSVPRTPLEPRPCPQLFFARGAPDAKSVLSFSSNPTPHYPPRPHDARRALSPLRPLPRHSQNCFLSTPASFSLARLQFPTQARFKNRLSRGGNHPEIISILHPSFIPTVDMNRTRDLAPPSTVINAQTPARATPANPRANRSRLTTPFPPPVPPPFPPHLRSSYLSTARGSRRSHERPQRHTGRTSGARNMARAQR